MSSLASLAGGIRLAGFSAALILAPAAGAYIIAEDSALVGAAKYQPGNLIGQGPPTAGFSGDWLLPYNGAQSPTVISGGLSYPGVAVGGGAFQYPLGGNGRSGRLLSRPLTDATFGTVYFSFLIQLSAAPEDADLYRALEMHGGGFDDGAHRKVQIGTGGDFSATPSHFGIRLFNSADFRADLGPADTEVNLFVGKITFSTDNNSDLVEIWRNPSTLSSETLSGPPDASLSGFNLQIDRVSIARFNGLNTAGTTWDEIRFASSWSEATTSYDPTDSQPNGLPDAWEAENGVSDPTGDEEPDGLNNLGEFNFRTDPNNPDTDGDGLNDGAEILAGSDPLITDTDGDGISDGDEVNLYGTSPILADTDNDGANDATEISVGTSPISAAETPSTALQDQVGLELFDYPFGSINDKAGGEGFDFDATLANDSFIGHTASSAPWTNAFGNPVVDCGKLHTRDGGVLREFNGPATGGSRISRFGSGQDSPTLYVKATLTRRPGATWSGISFFSDGVERAFAGVPDELNEEVRSFGAAAPGQSASFSEVEAVEGETFTIVAKLSGEFGELQFFVNPDLNGSEPSFDVSILLFEATATSFRLASGGSGDSIWDDVVVTRTWEAIAAATPTDSDGDGLRDTYELAYAADLNVLISAGADNDGDTLTNLQEQEIGSNPLATDTDGDGVPDNIEVADGTSPCNPDTDGDGLSDGEEKTLGTNPLLVDTDGDGDSDGQEVAQGTDPLDPLSNSSTIDKVILNGSRQPAYGDPLAVQTVQTQFGDNQSELNAAFARIQDGRLFLLLTGNLEGNFNKLHIFIDSTPAGSEVFTSAGNDGTAVMNGFRFDAGFAPDFHLIARRGNAGGDKFDLDFARLTTPAFDSYFNVFGTAQTGIASTPAGTVNASPIGVAYNDSNTGGVTGGTEAADQVAAAAVTTGLELSIALPDLGNPSGEIRILAMVNSGNHGFLSNQFLGGLPAPQGNLGGPVNAVNLTTFDGDQFFTVPVPVQSDIKVTDVRLVSGGAEIRITVEGLIPGKNYLVKSSSSLQGFDDLSAFTADAATRTLTYPATNPPQFFIFSDAP